MGELVLAAKVTHVPSIWVSLQPGKHHGIRRAAEEGLKEVGRRIHERGADTIVIVDTHWLNSSGFHINGRAHHSASYASPELPHFIPKLEYDFPGDPDLANLIGDEIRRGGQHSLVHDLEDLKLEYGTLVPMHLINAAEPRLGVVPMGASMYSSIDENLRVGAAVRRAIEASDRRVAFLASGSLSHQFPSNEQTRDYLNRITADFNTHMDLHVLQLWREGRVQEFLEILPEFNERCVGEGSMTDTAILFGLLGGVDYTGRGEELCPYFPSTGTGQTIVDFEITAPASAH